MTHVILSEGGTVMQFVGDAAMAVFGAPEPQRQHPAHAMAAAVAMHAAQDSLNCRWSARGLLPFELGIGLSTGTVAAALLGSDERLEYAMVGDVVNLTQRLQALAEPGETVLLDATYRALEPRPPAQPLGPLVVKGRRAPITVFRVSGPSRPGTSAPP